MPQMAKWLQLSCLFIGKMRKAKLLPRFNWVRMTTDDFRLAIVGLGYVGLPLAVEFGKNRPVIGFDISQTRVNQLRQQIDNTLEVSKEELVEAKGLLYTTELNDLKDNNVYIVTVPTPIDGNKQPDLTPLIQASKTIGQVLKEGDIVIFESTVYPGATEEVCVPVLEDVSGLKYANKDELQGQKGYFYCGYSPERINPGDKLHRVSNIKKVTAGSTTVVAEAIDQLYQEIVTVGTHKAQSIKVAEAAKVIENTQRDLNIALINELAILFSKLDIDTEAVLEAAGTKWNFLPFRPGLVGGHCIGVDPYYLTHKAQAIGYDPEIILSGRRINDGMAKFVATRLVNAMQQRQIEINNSKVLIMGLTFKEDCPDIRNTKVIDVVRELAGQGASVDVFDPMVDPNVSKSAYEIAVKSAIENVDNDYDAIVIAVAHSQFKSMGVENIRKLGNENCIIYDLKYLLGKDESDLRL